MRGKKNELDRHIEIQAEGSSWKPQDYSRGCGVLLQQRCAPTRLWMRFLNGRGAVSSLAWMAETRPAAGKPRTTAAVAGSRRCWERKYILARRRNTTHHNGPKLYFIFFFSSFLFFWLFIIFSPLFQVSCGRGAPNWETKDHPDSYLLLPPSVKCIKKKRHRTVLHQ